MTRCFNPRSAFNRILWGFILMSVAALASLYCHAETLPPVVLHYLYGKDPNVKVRFDGFITFSNGEMYLPVIPHSLTPQENLPQKVYAEDPPGVAYPDLVQFDNSFFLIRLVNTASGKLALAHLEQYPLALKEGLLPQDLVLPSNLYLPTELKVILGDLPYNPTSITATPNRESATTVETVIPPRAAFSQTVKTTSQPSGSLTTATTLRPMAGQRLYLTDLVKQSLIAVNLASPEQPDEIGLNCVASDMIPSSDNESLYVTCLTTNEMVVVDTRANLVKTRVEVGSKPTSVIVMPDRDWVAVSHRFSNFLSLVNTKALDGTTRVLLPGNGGEMAYSTSTRKLYVGDYSAGQIYEIDMDSQEVKRTLSGMKNMSDLWVDDRNTSQPKLWFTSRTLNKLVQLDLVTGEALRSFDVGQKPVAIKQVGDLLFVVSASSDEVQLIDLNSNQKLQPIALEQGAFPTDLSVSPADQRGYIATAGSDNVYVVNFATRHVEKTLPMAVRGLDITLVSNQKTDEATAKAFSDALINAAKPTPTLAPLQEQPVGPEPTNLSQELQPDAVVKVPTQ